MTTYGITSAGMTIYRDGQVIASFPIADFAMMIERLARAMQEAPCQSFPVRSIDPHAHP